MTERRVDEELELVDRCLVADQVPRQRHLAVEGKLEELQFVTVDTIVGQGSNEGGGGVVLYSMVNVMLGHHGEVGGHRVALANADRAVDKAGISPGGEDLASTRAQCGTIKTQRAEIMLDVGVLGQCFVLLSETDALPINVI